MDKFPIHVQNRIVGSRAKLERFRRGEDIHKIIDDGVSTDYRLKCVGGVDRVADVGKMVGYNSDMEVFNKKIITIGETSAINKWTESSKVIKASMWLHKPNVDAMLLFGLFDKYKSNVPIDVKVYRGMSLSEEDFNRFGFNDIAKGDLHTPDEAAIVSFSMDKRIAYGFAESEGKTHNISYK